MINSSERLIKLEEKISGQSDVCSSGGPVFDFPESMKKGFINFGIGLIVCHKGKFDFNLSGKQYKAHTGETVFIHEGSYFRITSQSDDIELSIIIYKVLPIRDVLGNMVYSVHLYSQMSPETHCVWNTGDEDDVAGYIALIGTEQPQQDDFFPVYEKRLLLLSLTYRLCSVFQKKFLSGNSAGARRTEIFLRLIQLIDRYFMSERGVEFYAGKLFLSPKYLSGLSKAVCGYTVQELVFKAIIRKCMAMLDSTNKTVQEISEEFNFPNPSSFGTFFKKQVGMSPQKYRERNPIN